MKLMLLLNICILIFAKIGLGDEPLETKTANPPLDKVTSCSQDIDCTAIVGCCQRWYPINKIYLNNKKYLIGALSYDCMSTGCRLYGSDPSDGDFQPVAACINKICTLTDKTTNINQKEWLHSAGKGS